MITPPSEYKAPPYVPAPPVNTTPLFNVTEHSFPTEISDSCCVSSHFSDRESAEESFSDPKISSAPFSSLKMDSPLNKDEISQPPPVKR